MPAQKRAYDDPVGPATPAPAGASSSSSGRTRPDKKSRRQQRRKEKQAAPTLPLNSNSTSTPRSTKDADLEEGEVVEGDFSDLFVVDTTPAAVRPKDRFLGEQSAATPLKGSKDQQGDAEDLVTLPMAAAEGKELVLEETKEAREDAPALDSDDAMRIFAQEMTMTDDSDDDSDDDDASEEEGDEFGGAAGQGLMLYDDEEELQKAIQGRIVDDSAAPVRPDFRNLVESRMPTVLTFRGRPPDATTKKRTSPRRVFSAEASPLFF